MAGVSGEDQLPQLSPEVLEKLAEAGRQLGRSLEGMVRAFSRLPAEAETAARTLLRVPQPPARQGETMRP
jgi:hypothetical protein